MNLLTTDGSDLHGWAEKRRAALGQAKLALCFQIPPQASLHGILKPIAYFAPQNAPAFCASRRNLLEKIAGLRLARQAGRCCKKASASPLASDFYKTASAFAQRINPVFSAFLSVIIFPIRGFLHFVLLHLPQPWWWVV
jgi:hypothetical protein